MYGKDGPFYGIISPTTNNIHTTCVASLFISLMEWKRGGIYGGRKVSMGHVVAFVSILVPLTTV